MALVVLLMVASKAPAQDLEPRAYSNAPVGLNFLLAGYTYSQGGLSIDPAVPIQDADIDIHTMILAYVRTFDLWGMSSKFNVMAPYACASGSATFAGEPKERDVCGFADPRFKLAINLYGAPALPAKEFADYKQDLIVGTSFQITPPAGQYDSSKLVNIGTNRWSFEPEIGVSKSIGPLIVELMTSATFYSDNTDFLEGHRLEVDPIYSIQGHIIYNLKSGIWCSLDGTYYRGGQTAINGVEGDTLQENTRVAVGAIAGDAGKGAAIGATAGGLGGGMRRRDQMAREEQKQEQWEQDQAAQYQKNRSNYNRAYKACLEGRKYSVK